MYNNRDSNKQQHRHPVVFDEHGNKKYLHWVHSPFTIEFNGVKVSIDENGKAIISQEHEGGEFDEIVTTAAFFNRVIRVLHTMRKPVYKDKPYKEEGGDVRR